MTLVNVLKRFASTLFQLLVAFTFLLRSFIVEHAFILFMIKW